MQGSIPDHANVPFGGGRHVCTGRKFAVTAIKIALSWLLRNFAFDAVATLPLPDYTTMVVAPDHSRGRCNVTYRRVK